MKLKAEGLLEQALELSREVAYMSRLEHPNLVNMFGVTESTPKAIVMEFVSGGDLFHNFHYNDEGVLRDWRAFEALEEALKSAQDDLNELRGGLGNTLLHLTARSVGDGGTQFSGRC